MANSVEQLSREAGNGIQLTSLGRFPGTRVLAWDGDILYASRGYELLRCQPANSPVQWQSVGHFSPAWWRNITASSKLGYRLMRDGFHALAALPNGGLVAAVPEAIVVLREGGKEFCVTHALQRGTRPLNFAVIPDGRIFWGEYFDNPARDAVHVYGSEDYGATWKVVFSFPQKSIRHIHNIVYDRWENCLWVLTGDVGEECRVLRVSLDWKKVDVVVCGNQQARTVAAVPVADGLYFASDAPAEQNYIYKLDRRGKLDRLAKVNSSVLCGCAVGDARFFTTMIEPSGVNLDRTVVLYGSARGSSWDVLQCWNKDRWSMRLFQYGNAFLPAGNNSTNVLALTTIAVEGHDLEASLWRVGI